MYPEVQILFSAPRKSVPERARSFAFTPLLPPKHPLTGAFFYTSAQDFRFYQPSCGCYVSARRNVPAVALPSFFRTPPCGVRVLNPTFTNGAALRAFLSRVVRNHARVYFYNKLSKIKESYWYQNQTFSGSVLRTESLILNELTETQKKSPARNHAELIFYTTKSAKPALVIFYPIRLHLPTPRVIPFGNNRTPRRSHGIPYRCTSYNGNNI